MRYFALATDYDGTLAHDGHVSADVVEAVQRLRQSGRKVILVTGRELDELQTVFPQIDTFDLIVAENGALLYNPATKEKQSLGAAPPASFIEELQSRGVGPISVGDVIVATWEPHQNTVLDVIRERGLDAQVIFNKGAVMILPAGVNKRSGLLAALQVFGISPHNVAGVGDAENDLAFLTVCECAVAVSNALDSVKLAAGIVTKGDHGTGVAELIEKMIADNLADYRPDLERCGVLVGGGVFLHAYGETVLVAGTSGGGKSTLVTGMLERLAKKGYQLCIIDPEGDYETFSDAVSVGDERHAPGLHEILRILEKADSHVVVNLLGVKLEDRPGFFAGLLPRLQEMRAKSGRPHWLVVDEAHHMLPESWAPASSELPDVLSSTILITVHPEHLAPPLLDQVRVVMALGKEPNDILVQFCRCVDTSCPPRFEGKLEHGEVLVWRRDGEQGAVKIKAEPPTGEKRRHKRKYMQGALDDEEAFYFRGPHRKLTLKAPNLSQFLQIGDGVDDETWIHHLKQHDYSKWFEGCIKDPQLADEAHKIEDSGQGAAETRKRIRELIEVRYTSPA